VLHLPLDIWSLDRASIKSSKHFKRFAALATDHHCSFTILSTRLASTGYKSGIYPASAYYVMSHIPPTLFTVNDMSR